MVFRVVLAFLAYYPSFRIQLKVLSKIRIPSLSKLPPTPFQRIRGLPFYVLRESCITKCCFRLETNVFLSRVLYLSTILLNSLPRPLLYPSVGRFPSITTPETFSQGVRRGRPRFWDLFFPTTFGSPSTSFCSVVS